MQTDKQKAGWTDAMKLTVTFCDYANAATDVCNFVSRTSV